MSGGLGALSMAWVQAEASHPVIMAAVVANAANRLGFVTDSGVTGASVAA
jgi:hypothetical protein